MWPVWILLFTVCFKDSTAIKTITKELMHGSKLTIKLSNGYDTLEYTPVDKSEKITLYSKGVSPKRGQVVKVGEHKEFIISSVTFNDQGTYQVRNFWNTLASIYLLKVISKQDTYNCVAGETLTIPLEGLKLGETSLSFFSENLNLTLVSQGSAVGKKHPDYFGRIEVTSSNIKILNVNVSDVGNYTLTDQLGRTVSIIRMILIDHREGTNVGLFMSLLLLLGIPVGVCCCCRKRIFKNSSTSTTTTANTVKLESSVTPPDIPPVYSDPTDPAMVYPGYPTEGMSSVIPPPQLPFAGPPAMNPALNPVFNPNYQSQSSAYPLAPGFSPVQPPQWSDAPHNPPAPAGFMMYNAPAPATAGPEPNKVQGMEISASTPLLPPPQSEVALPPTLYTGPNVLNSTDSAAQISINMEKNSSTNFL